MTEEQLAFDIEGMIHEAAVEAAPDWSGAPLHFTTAYFSPGDLDVAFEHWQFLHKLDNSRTQSRVWHRAITVPGGVREDRPLEGREEVGRGPLPEVDAGRWCTGHHRAQQHGHATCARPLALGWLRHLPHRRRRESGDRAAQTASYARGRTGAAARICDTDVHRSRRLIGSKRTPV